jgi:protein-L-isoaspartate(D-aspartate) O-methyltransferase
VTETPEVLSRRLFDSLVDQGEISRRWAAAMHAVPRHRYIPDAIYRHDQGRSGNDLVPVRRGEQPDEWLNLVYSDIPVNTQVNDGHPDPDGTGFEVSSSSSAPSVMAGMLDDLDAQPGMRVLEIGTGTGWNAALLAHTVGPDNVTTIEIDPAVAEQARKRLADEGYPDVAVLTGDGAHGWPIDSPYDRVIATVGAATVPYQWIKQTRPGGRIVVPMTTTYRSPGVAVLTRNDDGTATGGFTGPAAFMALRARRSPRVRSVRHGAPADHTSVTQLHPHRLVGRRASAIAIGFRIAGVSWVWQPDGQLGTLWFYAPETRSWATVTLLDRPPYPVEQAGPRRLFDEVAAAYRWWHETGEPDVGDWLITVTPDDQRIELCEKSATQSILRNHRQ